MVAIHPIRPEKENGWIYPPFLSPVIILVPWHLVAPLCFWTHHSASPFWKGFPSLNLSPYILAHLCCALPYQCLAKRQGSSVDLPTSMQGNAEITDSSQELCNSKVFFMRTSLWLLFVAHLLLGQASLQQLFQPIPNPLYTPVTDVMWSVTYWCSGFFCVGEPSCYYVRRTGRLTAKPQCMKSIGLLYFIIFYSTCVFRVNDGLSCRDFVGS